MLRYLKAAFFVGVDVPALGRIPANALGVAAFGIFGFVQPAFWFLGMGLETAFLFALASNDRFRKIVDAQALQVSEDDTESKRQALVKELPTDLQKRLAGLTRQCDKVLGVYRNLQAEDFVIGTNQEALRRLQWLYLKLLVGRYHLAASNEGTDRELMQKIANLEADLKDVETIVPELLTPGAAEALAMKIYRVVKTQNAAPLDALRGALANYRPPIPLNVMNEQIRLAVRESSDFDFVPTCFTKFCEPRDTATASAI